MIRVTNTIELNTYADPANVVNLTQNVAVDAFPSLLGDVYTNPIKAEAWDEVKSRIIFNSGANNIFYAIGQDCDGVKNFNAWIVPGQQLDCSDHPQRVSVICTAGAGQFTTTLLRRKDLVQTN